MKTIKLTAIAFAALSMVAASCSKYDDSALLDEIKNLKDRISNLENQEPVDNSLRIEMDDSPICFAAVDTLAYTYHLSLPFTVVGEGAETATVSVEVTNITEPDGYVYCTFEMTDATHGIASASRYYDIEVDGGDIYATYTGYELRVSAVNKNGQSAFRIVKVTPQYYDFGYYECDIQYDNDNRRAYIEASNKAGSYKLDYAVNYYCAPGDVEAVSNSPQIFLIQKSPFSENQIQGITTTEFVSIDETEVSEATYFELGTGFMQVSKYYSATINWPANTTGSDRVGKVNIYRWASSNTSSGYSSVTSLWIYQSK